MRKLICLIVLAAFISVTCGETFAQKQSLETSPPVATSPFPQSEVEINLSETWPETPLLAGLKAEIEKQWLQQGKFWFSRETSDGTIRQVGDVSCRLQPMELTSPDRLNDIQWHGFVSFSWKAERFYFPGQEKWTRWEAGGALSFEVYVEDGKADFQKVSLLRHPRTSRESELVKPEKGQIEAIIGKPKMTMNESAKLSSEFSSFPEEPTTTERTNPRVLFMPKPKYTEDARINKVTGKVMLAVEVFADGSVGRISVVRSLGYGLDENAMMTARQGRFSPATLNGKAVRATTKIEVSFNVY